MTASQDRYDDRLAMAFAEQSGVLTRAQLDELNVSRSETRAQLEARRWQLLNDQVICMHNGPLTPAQQRWAVGLSAQGAWALGGLTGMGLWGVHRLDTQGVDVLVRRGAKVLPVRDVTIKVHESRRFSRSDVRERCSLPVTSLTRATVDAATWTPDPQAASRIFVAPVMQRLVTAEQLRTELINAGHIRHRGVLLSLADDLCGGAQALSEVEFLRFCRRHRLPRPTCQRRLDSNGRHRYLDANFRRPDGRVVRVEIDGGVHLSLAVRWADTAKDNDAVLDKTPVLRFPSVAIYTDDARALAQLRRALAC